MVQYFFSINILGTRTILIQLISHPKSTVSKNYFSCTNQYCNTDTILTKILQNTSGMCEFSQASDVCGATTDNSEAATDDDSDDDGEQQSVSRSTSSLSELILSWGEVVTLEACLLHQSLVT